MEIYLIIYLVVAVFAAPLAASGFSKNYIFASLWALAWPVMLAFWLFASWVHR